MKYLKHSSLAVAARPGVPLRSALLDSTAPSLVLFWRLDPPSLAPLRIPAWHCGVGQRTAYGPARRDVTGVEPQLHSSQRKSGPRAVLPQLRDYRSRVPVD